MQTRRRPRRRDQQHREAAQPQRHQHEPREGTDRRCRGGAARLGEEDRHDGQRRGPGRPARAGAGCRSREPSQRLIGTAIAATQPTAFQYSKGCPMRFDISFSASEPGHTREASA